MNHSLNREILRLSVPSILAGITVPLVGMVDTAVAGHLSGDTAAQIGAISVGSMVLSLLYWTFGFLRTGTGGLTAQAFGRGDFAECGRIFLRGTGLAVTRVNLLDGTVEGVSCERAKAFGVQYHPESAPGPQDSAHLFDDFIRLMREGS